MKTKSILTLGERTYLFARALGTTFFVVLGAITLFVSFGLGAWYLLHLALM